MLKRKLFKDTINGVTSLAVSKTGGWMLIRSHCKANNLQVPTIDQVVQISENVKLN